MAFRKQNQKDLPSDRSRSWGELQAMMPFTGHGIKKKQRDKEWKEGKHQWYTSCVGRVGEREQFRHGHINKELWRKVSPH